MRVSTKTFQLQWLNNFTQRQLDLVQTQRQVSTGRRVATAADDPAGASQMVLLQQGLDRIDAYRANAETARRRLSLAESSLNQATDVLDRIRELAVQAGGVGQDAQSRAALADEAEELLTSLVDIANAQDGEGRYLFSGSRVDTRPFEISGNGVAYAGDSETRSQRVGDSRLVTENDPGSEVFVAIRNGNGVFRVEAAATNTGTAYYTAASVSDPAAWTPASFRIEFTAPDAYELRDAGGNLVQSGAFAPGDTIAFSGVGVTLDGEPAAGDRFTIEPSRMQDMFATARSFVSLMRTGGGDAAARARAQTGINNVLQDLDQALGRLSEVRSGIGARLSAISQQTENNEELTLQYTQTLSLIRDVDYASAISDLENQLIGLEAAQKAFARTRAFSLFDVI